ncbi:hypothetical protein [Stieleria mannarensis]|uniref:hypothetical protein n=1 Tax=Stieleria mannarensis TaxID=2755585 RepID=UPI001600A30B|nr:hypothetical protein [Rhodopirellula sp. JC639]
MSIASPTSFADEIGKFMTHLFGLKVSTTEIKAQEPSHPLAAVATYTDGHDLIRGQIVCDLRCVSILGAALTQIPMGVVDDSLETGELSANLRANAYEVFNICVNLFSYPQSRRVVLSEVRFEKQAEMPTMKPSWKSDAFQINIERYGSGFLRLIHCV